MDQLSIFRGDHDPRLVETQWQRDEVIRAARKYLPDDYLGQIKASGGECDVELGWVTVADPTGESDITLEVMPVLTLWKGQRGNERVDAAEPHIEPGVASISFVGILPDGGERQIGAIDCNLKRGDRFSGLTLNNSKKDFNATHSTELESADAEIFLKLAASVMGALDNTVKP